MSELEEYELILHGDHVHTIEFVVNVISSVREKISILKSLVNNFTPQLVPACSRKQAFDTTMIVSKEGSGVLLKGSEKVLSKVRH